MGNGESVKGESLKGGISKSPGESLKEIQIVTKMYGKLKTNLKFNQYFFMW